MGDDLLVGLDALHVDAVLLLPDDHGPPQLALLPLLLRAARRDWLHRLPRPAPIGCSGIWLKQTPQNTTLSSCLEGLHIVEMVYASHPEGLVVWQNIIL